MKNLLLMFFCSLCLVSNAQELLLTPVGLRNAKDLDKTYVVINLEGKSAKELYNSAIKYINKTYKNPEAVIKGKVEGEFLKFNTRSESALTGKKNFVGFTLTYDLTYTTELSFKDGKVKYEIISLQMPNHFNLNDDTDVLYLIKPSGGLLRTFGIWDENGNLLIEKTKNQMENYFNSELSVLVDVLNGSNEEEKW